MTRAATLFAVAGLAVGAASLGADIGIDADRSLHAHYAGVFAAESRTQAVVLVAVDAPTLDAWGPPPWTSEHITALAGVLTAARPRLIIWPEGHVGRGFASAPEDRRENGGNGSTLGIDPLIGSPLTGSTDGGFEAAALQALGFPESDGPLPAHYVSVLPTVSAHRVAAGEIPSSTFRDRVIIVGRSDREAATVATPLGPMSPAQAEAHALLGVLDGVPWIAPPSWMRHGAMLLWGVCLARAVRGRSSTGVLAIAVAACGLAALVDLGLFVAGVARIGVSVAVLVAVAAAVVQLALPTQAALKRAWTRRRLGERADAALAAASAVSGVYTWSDAVLGDGARPLTGFVRTAPASPTGAQVDGGWDDDELCRHYTRITHGITPGMDPFALIDPAETTSATATRSASAIDAALSWR